STCWRFSLRTLLLLVVIVCIAIPLGMQSYKLHRAETELRQLRNEVGYLSVDDRSKVHVIAVDMNEPNSWRWRIFLPQGVRYSWCLGFGDIPAKGVPQPKLKHTSNEPYSDEDVEVVVTARLRQLEDGDWSLSVSSMIGDQLYQMGGARVTIPSEEMRRIQQVSVYDGHTRGTRGTEAINPNEPIVLLQKRVCEKQPDGSYQPWANPMPGYMIWMEKE
ncbi:MAG TPA: hypothetical protein VHK01_02810, partial [Lacipirellulaceae bacterium]|nr:hypothetical protein [Lacipirellulaceae bacterium]